MKQNKPTTILSWTRKDGPVKTKPLLALHLQDFSIDNLNFHIFKLQSGHLRVAYRYDGNYFAIYANSISQDNPTFLRKLFINAWTTLEKNEQSIIDFINDPYGKGIVRS